MEKKLKFERRATVTTGLYDKDVFLVVQSVSITGEPTGGEPLVHLPRQDPDLEEHSMTALFAEAYLNGLAEAIRIANTWKNQ